MATYFLRDKFNQTIVDCEVSKKDVHCAINISNYTKFYTSLYDEDEAIALGFRDDIDEISEIRGWWWEREEDDPKWKSIDEFVDSVFSDTAEHWQLNYVKD